MGGMVGFLESVWRKVAHVDCERRLAMFCWVLSWWVLRPVWRQSSWAKGEACDSRRHAADKLSASGGTCGWHVHADSWRPLPKRCRALCMELLGSVTRCTTPTDTDLQTHARHAADVPANAVTALLGACPHRQRARVRQALPRAGRGAGGQCNRMCTTHRPKAQRASSGSALARCRTLTETGPLCASSVLAYRAS